MLIVQQIKGFETTAWCAVCGSVLRAHKRMVDTGRRAELDPGWTANHVVVDGVSLCQECLKAFPARRVVLDVIASELPRYDFSIN